MAITLYRPGKSHIIRGVQCVAKNFEVRHLQAAIRAGWFTDPNEMKQKPGRKGSDPLPDRAVIAGGANASEDRRNK